MAAATGKTGLKGLRGAPDWALLLVAGFVYCSCTPRSRPHVLLL
jgi:hypothetical protein